MLVLPFGVCEPVPVVPFVPVPFAPGVVVVPEPVVPVPVPLPDVPPVPVPSELEPVPAPPVPEPPEPPEPLPAPCAIASDAKLNAKTVPTRIFFICFPPSVIVVAKVEQQRGEAVPKYIF